MGGETFGSVCVACGYVRTRYSTVRIKCSSSRSMLRRGRIRRTDNTDE